MQQQRSSATKNKINSFFSLSVTSQNHCELKKKKSLGLEDLVKVHRSHCQDNTQEGSRKKIEAKRLRKMETFSLLLCLILYGWIFFINELIELYN